MFLTRLTFTVLAAAAAVALAIEPIGARGRPISAESMAVCLAVALAVAAGLRALATPERSFGDNALIVGAGVLAGMFATSRDDTYLTTGGLIGFLAGLAVAAFPLPARRGKPTRALARR